MVGTALPSRLAMSEPNDEDRELRKQLLLMVQRSWPLASTIDTAIAAYRESIEERMRAATSSDSWECRLAAERARADAAERRVKELEVELAHSILDATSRLVEARAQAEARADEADESARMMSERVERLVKANLELKARADAIEESLALCEAQRDNAEAGQRAMSERCERAEAKVQECVKMNELQEPRHEALRAAIAKEIARAAMAKGEKPCPSCGGVGEHYKTATDILTQTDHGEEKTS